MTRLSLFLACLVFTVPFVHADELLKKRFIEEYPHAVERLRLVSVVGSGTIRERSSPWNDVTFYFDDKRTRFHRNLTGWEQAPAQVLAKGTVRTPKLSAVVDNPNSPTAHLAALNEPLKAELEINLNLFRHLLSSYCIDGKCLADEITAKRALVVNVMRSEHNSDWIAAKITLLSEDGLPTNAEGLVHFSPAEDWAIRQMRVTVGEPYNFSFSSKNTCREVPGIGFVVDSHTRTEDGAFHSEFKLAEIRSEELSDDLFTLAALGISDESLMNVRLLIVSLGVAILAAASTYIARRRAR